MGKEFCQDSKPYRMPDQNPNCPVTNGRRVGLSMAAFLIGLAGAVVVMYLYVILSREATLENIGFMLMFGLPSAVVAWLAIGVPFSIKVDPDSKALLPKWMVLTSVVLAILGYMVSCVVFSVLTGELHPLTWLALMVLAFGFLLLIALPISLIATPLYSVWLRREVRRHKQ